MAGGHSPGGDLQQLPGEAGLHQRKTGEANGGLAALDVEAAAGSGGGKDAAAADEAAGAAAADKEDEQYANVTYLDITKQFSLLGWTAFGGPAAHIGLFQRVRAALASLQLAQLLPLLLQHACCQGVVADAANAVAVRVCSNAPPAQRLVDKLRWMSDDVYAELFALGQCMPGPTSTQVSFAIGVIKKGVRGEQQGNACSRMRMQCCSSLATCLPTSHAPAAAALAAAASSPPARWPAVWRAVPVPWRLHHDGGRRVCSGPADQLKGRAGRRRIRCAGLVTLAQQRMGRHHPRGAEAATHCLRRRD